MSTFKKIKYGNRTGCIELFSNAQEVVSVSEHRQLTDRQFHDLKGDDYEVREDWHGVKSYSDALYLMRSGYQPTVEKMRGLLKANIGGECKRISFRNEVSGFQPIIPLALQGVPNCMVNTYMKPIKTKVINIFYDSTVSAGTSCEDIIKAGQKILGALIELEMQGYRFNLYAVQSYNDSSKTYVMAVKVKSSNTALDLKRISFPLTHTAFFRVIGFDWYSRCPQAKYMFGYGHALQYEMNNQKAAEMLSQAMGEKVIYFSATGILRNGSDDIKEVITNDKI